ncbi:regulatory protein RecX [Nocardia panacis]|uniref:Regulatory protein RecX n=1 Tax=Nocardia panacis TaxID=2340916 RepID=A0A3A4KGZ8_9NOCA|nr:regulatory protein RecX [Nocardia panacis]
MGSRSSAPDPQRARSAGSPRGRRAGARSGTRASATPSADDPEDLVAAGSSGTVEQAKEASLRLLAVRARSRAELSRRLTMKGFAPETIEAALERLAEVGLIDDAAFAEQWVYSRHTFSGKGKQALARELRVKGVAPTEAAAALSAITSDDEAARATALIRRKIRTPITDPDKTLRRLVAMLTRRGYSPATAFAVVKAELAQADSEKPPPEFD